MEVHLNLRSPPCPPSPSPQEFHLQHKITRHKTSKVKAKKGKKDRGGNFMLPPSLQAEGEEGGRGDGGAGYFWAHAMHVAYLARPTEPLRLALLEVKKALRWPEDQPVLSIHLVQGGLYFDAELYLARCQEMQALYGVQHVFLTGDGGSSLEVRVRLSDRPTV